MYISETRFVVRYAETDQMGIVHHSNYPIWYEVGRTDFIEKAGMKYSDMEQNGVLLPLIELKSEYKGAAKYEDRITVQTSIKTFTNTRVVFKYQIYKNNESKVINEGETMHVWTTKELKPINLKKFMPDIYDIIKKIVEL